MSLLSQLKSWIAERSEGVADLLIKQFPFLSSLGEALDESPDFLVAIWNQVALLDGFKECLDEVRLVFDKETVQDVQLDDVVDMIFAFWREKDDAVSSVQSKLTSLTSEVVDD